jgi:hypothetical protein
LKAIADDIVFFNRDCIIHFTLWNDRPDIILRIILNTGY